LTAICIRQSPTWNILLHLALSTAGRNDNAECKRMFQIGDRRMHIAVKNHTGRHTKAELTAEAHLAKLANHDHREHA